jgi:hypothetical protein
MEKDYEEGRRMARAFLVDVNGHLCGLTKRLQGKHRLISMIQ